MKRNYHSIIMLYIIWQQFDPMKCYAKTFYRKKKTSWYWTVSHNSVTPVYWDTKGTDTRDTALASAVFTVCFILAGVPSNVLIVVRILPTFILLLNLTTADFLMRVLIHAPFLLCQGLLEASYLGVLTS